MMWLFRRRAAWAVTGLILATCLRQATALDGANASQYTTNFNGWKSFELLTQGNNITGLAEAGYGATMTRNTNDGLGAYADGGTLNVFVNHESSPASISRVQANITNLQQQIQRTIDNGLTPVPPSIVSGVGLAYTTIYTGNTPTVVATGYPAIVNYGNANFSRFCSGTMYTANSFAPGRGFADPMYITGEEVSGGLFYAIDPATRNMWEVSAAGPGLWENAALLDTGNTTHVAVLLQSDNGTSPGDYMRLYVGQKNVDVNGDLQIDFLERNGLRGGTIYHYIPDVGFSTTNLPTTTPVTGTWSTATTGALQETKLEDIHTNPLNGQEAAFADQTDGVYLLSVNLNFTAGILNTATSTGTISRIYGLNGGDINAPDNLFWSRDGRIYLDEDGSGNDIWYLNPDGTGVTQMFHSAVEPSGIIDISDMVGYLPGSIFLGSALSGSNSQLIVMVSPDAVPVPEPGCLVLFAIGGVGLFAVARHRRAVRAR